jgi:hypothetical protein
MGQTPSPYHARLTSGKAFCNAAIAALDVRLN